MMAAPAAEIRDKLAALRTELVDLAYTLECRGRLDAADVAIETSVRIGELCEELANPEANPFLGAAAPAPRIA